MIHTRIVVMLSKNYYSNDFHDDLIRTGLVVGNRIVFSVQYDEVDLAQT